MTAVTQTISSYTFGISEQPDSRKKPGQLTFLDNALPDITSGLVKRPGTRYVTELTETPGTWFNYYRDGNEQYMGHIAFTTGAVTVWNVLTGTQVPFNGTNSNDYLKHTKNSDISTYTINDVTYIVNRTKIPKMKTTKSPTRVSEAFYEVKTLAYGRTYQVDLWNVNADGTRGKLAESGTYTTPGATVDNTNTISTATILSAIFSAVNNKSGFSCNIIGNGIYFQRTSKFLISCTDTSLGNAFSNKVNKLSRLPYQCKAGYEVKVVDEQEEDGSSFYVKFFGNGGDESANPPKLGGDGEGFWTEWIAPDVYTTFDETTMPHELKRTSTAQGAAQFELGPVTWDTRKVGDDDSNPLPSFISEDDPTSATAGNRINKVLLFRNRLIFLNEGNVFMSAAGDFTNLWAESQLTIGASDPIDVSVSTQQPATLYDGLEITSGFLIFGRTAQFLLTTDNDLLTQETATVSTISNYEFDIQTNPVSLGTSFGFCNTGGRNFRFFEMQQISRDTEPFVDELSKVVARYLPSSITHIADSKEEQLLLFATDDTAFTPEGIVGSRATEVWGYRYFDSGRERLQSSWFRWTMPGRVLYHCIMSDVYYVAIDVNGQVQLHEGDIKSQIETAFIIDLPEAVYRIHLDNRTEVKSAAMTYVQSTDTTTFNLPTGLFNLSNTVVTDQKIVEGVPTPAPAEVTKLTDIPALNARAAAGSLHDGDLFDVQNSAGANVDASPAIANLPLPTTLWNSRMTVRVKWRNATTDWEYQAHFPTIISEYRKVACYTIDESPNQGRLAFPEVNGQSVSLKGNWKNYLEIQCTNQGDLSGLIDGEYHNMKTQCTANCGAGANAARNLTVSIRVQNQRITRVWIVDPGENYASNANVQTVKIPDGEVTGDIFQDATFSVTTKTTDLDIGYLFRMSLQLPKIFPTRTEGSKEVSDTRCSLIIHRLNFDIGPTGNWSITLQRRGRESWTEDYTGPYFDYYKADDPALVPEMRMTVPCYERNTNLTVDLWSEHPSPFTLYTMSWEGDYSNKFYTRR